jgi:hypothetical protein
LRLFCGKASICFWVTLVPTSEVLRSRLAEPTMSRCSVAPYPGAQRQVKVDGLADQRGQVRVCGAKSGAVIAIL